MIIRSDMSLGITKADVVHITRHAAAVEALLLLGVSCRRLPGG
jgi:hypothetical protein